MAPEGITNQDTKLFIIAIVGFVEQCVLSDDDKGPI